MIITEGATLTGGSSVTLTPSGIQPGKSTFVGPGHSRLTPDVVEITTSQNPGNPKTGVVGQARTGVKIRRENSSTAEGCCTVQSDYAIIDLGVRFSLTAQGASAAEAAWDRLKALSFKDVILNAVLDGVLPQS